MIYTKKNIEPSIRIVRVCLLFLFNFLFINCLTAQFSKLIINEFSQGSGGTKEYIELLVVGKKTCTDSTADLRGWIIDDSNGWFGTGGIQGGHLRLAINANWQKVPYGSIILIYNDQDKNAQIILPDDPTDNFPKDNVYIVPANSIYTDENNNVPLGFGMGVTSYAGAAYTNMGNWNRISLGNGGDAVILVDPLFPTVAHFSIAYGTINTGSPDVYKNAVTANTNCYLTDANYTVSSSYVTGIAGINETPGKPNGGLNTAWILSMRVSPIPPTVSVNSSTICAGSTATITAVPNPSSIYTYTWNVPTGATNPGNVASFPASIAGNYIVTITNALNCSATNSGTLTVNPVPPAPLANAQSFCAANNPTVNDLVAAGNNLQWYNALTGGSPLISSTPLVTATYYVSQTITGCESTRSPVIINVTSQATPIFTQIQPVCQNSTAPILPSISNNNISGTWNPSTINTAITGTTTYIFTPDANECAASFTMDVTILNQVVPSFNAIGPLCQNSSATILSKISNNNISGTWNPSTINTAITGTTTYTFTPDANECAASFTMDVTILNQVVPSFNAIGPLCQNSSATILPKISNNNISGTWNPSTINTAIAGTATYTFTPDVNECATNFTLDVTVLNQVVPSFNIIGTLCQNSIPPILRSISNNNIYGIWNPSAINTATAGTTTYTFTPNAAKCATTVNMDIVVNVTPSPMRYPTINATINLPQQLQARIFTPAAKYMWSPVFGINNSLINNPVFNDSRSIEYLISILTAEGCSVVDTLLVKVVPPIVLSTQPSNVFVPNAFSPNGDGLNDKLTPVLLNINDLKYFRIFNRWGQMIFETKTPGTGWDGTLKGIALETGLYVWTLEAVGIDKVFHKKKGTIILIR